MAIQSVQFGLRESGREVLRVIEISHSLTFDLGNNLLYYFITQSEYMLRIEMEDHAGVKKFAAYDRFLIGDESVKYRLTISGYFGDAGKI